MGSYYFSLKFPRLYSLRIFSFIFEQILESLLLFLIFQLLLSSLEVTRRSFEGV